MGWASAISICGAPVASVQPSTPAPMARAGLERLAPSPDVDAVVGEDLVDVVPVVLADHRPQLRADVRDVVDAGVAIRRLHRHHHVDAVRLAAHVLVDPVQLELELVGREGERAEHAHAAGVGDRGDDVAAVREGEDRELDAEHLGETVLHGVTSIASCLCARVVGLCPKAGAGSRRRDAARAAPCSPRCACGSARRDHRASALRRDEARRRRSRSGPSARRARRRRARRTPAGGP